MKRTIRLTSILGQVFIDVGILLLFFVTFFKREAFYEIPNPWMLAPILAFVPGALCAYTSFVLALIDARRRRRWDWFRRLLLRGGAIVAMDYANAFWEDDAH